MVKLPEIQIGEITIRPNLLCEFVIQAIFYYANL